MYYLSASFLGIHPDPSSTFPGQDPESKPLLRVWPSFREEECEWAIRWDICLRCVKRNFRYAQKIHFYKEGLYRESGCYTEEKGFFLIER
ncbi:hypothetical protein [Leptospira perolatii]|uniref:hypothetical protein n=1 Tax=Leptospira perolatii TaxID=2023191 RepID=UPI003C6D7F1D